MTHAHMGAPSPAEGSQKPVWTWAQPSPTNHHCHRLTTLPMPLARGDRLTDRKHRSATLTNLGRRGMENRCAGPVWRRQLRPHRHFNQHCVIPALMSLRTTPAPGSSSSPVLQGHLLGASPGPGLLQREGCPRPISSICHTSFSCQIIRTPSSWVTSSCPRKWQLILGWQRRALRVTVQIRRSCPVRPRKSWLCLFSLWGEGWIRSGCIWRANLTARALT